MDDKFQHISYGIILPIIILFGLPGNMFALCVLHHRFLRSSPVFLLKVLAIHGIVTLSLSIYLEVIPTIKMHYRIDSTKDYNMFDFRIHLNTTINNTSPYKISTTSNSNKSKTSNNETDDRDHMYLGQTVNDFFSNNLIHIGLLVTLCLTIERLIAVMFPLKAMHCLTTGKTRIIVILLFILCISVHLPQLIKEITMINNCRKNGIDPKTTKSIINPIRKDYQSFFAYFSLAVCILVFVLNITLLLKLYKIKANLRHCRHLQVERNEINVSVAIAVLVFFQLPFHVFSTVLNELSFDFVFHNIQNVVKFMTVSRLLYIAHSALNFVIYCLMAKNCRYVLQIMFRRFSRLSVSHSFHRNENNGSVVTKAVEGIPLHDRNESNRTRYVPPTSDCLMKKESVVSMTNLT